MRKREPKCLLAGCVCPKNGDPDKGDYCPRWWRESWTDDKNITQVREGCGDVMLPQYMSSLHRAMTHAAEEASGLKNDARGIIERKLEEALSAMPAFVRQVVQRTWVPQVVDTPQTKVTFEGPDGRPRIEFENPETRC